MSKKRLKEIAEQLSALKNHMDFKKRFALMKEREKIVSQIGKKK